MRGSASTEWRRSRRGTATRTTCRPTRKRWLPSRTSTHTTRTCTSLTRWPTRPRICRRTRRRRCGGGSPTAWRVSRACARARGRRSAGCVRRRRRVPQLSVTAAVHLASRAHGVCKPAGGQAGQACDGGPAAARAGPAEGTAQALQVGARACRAVQARQDASPVPRVRAVRARQAAPGVPRLQRGFAALVPAQQAQARLQSVQRVPAQPGEAVLQGLQRLRRVCARPAAQKLPRVLPSVAQRKVPTRPLTQPLQRVPRTHGRP